MMKFECADLAQRTCAAVVGMGLLCPAFGMAQSASAPVPERPRTNPQVVDTSATHAAAKGATFKAATSTTWAIVSYIGTGNFFDASALTAITALNSYAVYVLSDYGWDYFLPVGGDPASGSFDTSASLWRNTGKYLTYKTAITAANWGTVYLYTGSLAQMFGMGIAISIASPVIFYANNMTWDWFDWYSKQSVAKATHAG